MKELRFSYAGSLLAGSAVEGIGERLAEETEALNQAHRRGFEDDRASINLPDQRNQSTRKLAEEKKRLDPAYIVVAGIGGSNLGTVAVQEAVQGKLHNQKAEKPKILYADTVDSDKTYEIMQLMEYVFRKKENVLLNGVSKSGSTTETIANFEILAGLIKKHKKNYQEHIVVTTDKGSRYWDYALDEGYPVLEIPKKVGGRYSVFSPAGLFPLEMVGVDTRSLLSGARAMRDRCLKTDLYENPAALSAAHIFLHSRKKRDVYNMFLFSTDLESVGKWYRQLMAESLGKQHDKAGAEVFEGITPTVAIGSTDLHSMAQLYLGGPQDKYTTFVGLEREEHEVKVPQRKDPVLVEGIAGRSLKDIMDAILAGTKAAYLNAGRPFSEITLPDKKEESIGQLLQMKMIETMYLGFILNVNPFDQPSVEGYKKETRRILERK